MKKVWIEVNHFDKSFITDAIEHGVDAFVVKNARIGSQIEALARIALIDKGKLPGTVRFTRICSKEEALKAADMPEKISLVLQEWKIIPLENLLAVRNNLFAAVNSAEEAVTALGILEKGVSGVYIKDCREASGILKKIKQQKESISLHEGEILSIRHLPLGDRICVDTITSMTDGEGMLVGDYSSGMVLVNSESLENPYVASRPFRVNAGALHCYILVPEGKTRYLADLKSGDEVLIVNHKGETVTSVVGRIKQELRPLLRIEVKGEHSIFSVILQNAETIRLVTPGGSSCSVVKLKEGDRVLVHEETKGRHFGIKIEETITEK